MALLTKTKIECGICTSQAIQTRIVSCPSCQYVSCNTCLKTYFKEISEPRCPSCLVIWTREFVMIHFKAYKKEYTKMRERFLFERELALMPDTQFFAENEMKARELETIGKDEINAEINECRKQMNELLRKRNDMFEMVSSLRNLTDYRNHSNDPKLVSKCPKFSDNGCRGFIYESDWKCGLCQTKICKKCSIVVSNDAHECKPEDIESIKQIKKDSKPCPKCATAIFKIDGCDQMWCTQCQTAFSWKTGSIVNGRVHNPHFYEWQRQINNGVAPRVEDYNGCEGVNIEALRHAFYQRKFPTAFRNQMYKLHQFIGHLDATVTRPTPVNNLKLRISFLLKEITEEDFVRVIQQLDKKYQKGLDVRNVTDVFIGEIETIFRDSVNLTIQITTIAIQRRIDTVIEFVNTQFNDIGLKYQNVPKKIVYDTNNESYFF